MHVRCPHCHNAIEIVGDSEFTDVTCPSCGSAFNLLPETEHYTSQLRTIGHFQLIEQIGTGGFGTVWKAKDNELDRLVAVKIPRRDQVAPEDAEMFLREARAAAQVKHPNIVAVHEIGRDNGCIYIVSDFVQGVTLADRVTAGPYSVREAAALLAQIAEALHHAHEARVIHRDLKPQNIMLDGDGRPHIMDFGLAKREAGEITVTVEGRVLGTAAYMSPEQARGEGHTADRRTDVYSLGVILFQLLTGELPFRGNRAMLLNQVLHDEPPSPRKFNGRVPRDLETICLKCLNKDPRHRYSTTKDVADELERWSAGRPIQARAVGQTERLWRWARRNPLIATLIATIAASMLIGTTISSYFAVRATKNAQVAETNASRANAKTAEALGEAKRAEREKQRADGKTEEALANLYSAQMNLAQMNWEGARVAAVLDLLGRWKARPNEKDLRGFEWYYWDRQCHSDLATLKGHTDLVTSVTFSPDGKLVASASRDRTVKLWDVVTGRNKVRLKRHADTVLCVAFSPDGAQIASACHDHSIKLWDTASGNELKTLIGHSGQVLNVSFSPDGSRIASVSLDGQVKLWDAMTHQEIHTLTSHTSPWPKSIQFSGGFTGLTFSPDGSVIAFVGLGSIKLWDPVTGREIRTIKTPSCSIAFSPDGTRIASGGISEIHVWDVATGQEIRRLHGHARRVATVAFSPDGTQIASGSYDQTVRLWDAATGVEIDTLKGHTSSVKSVAFSPDGKRIASGSDDQTLKIWGVPTSLEKEPKLVFTGVALSPDGTTVAAACLNPTVLLLDAATGQEKLILLGHSRIARGVAFSADGRRLVSWSDDQTVKLWDVATGQEIHTLRGHMKRITSVAFSPDGMRIASGSDDQTINLWEAATGRKIDTLKGHTSWVTSVAFSPDGTQIASGSNDQTVRLWDAATGQNIDTLKGHTSGVSSVAFSPEGKRIASGSSDQTINLWETATGRKIDTLKGHTSWVKCVAFSHDGTRIASGSGDGTAKLWDAATGQETVTLKFDSAQDSNHIQSVGFSKDGTRFVSGSLYEVKVWDARPWTADLRLEQQALGIVQFLYKEYKTKEEILEKIAADRTISEAVRSRSLELADVYWGRARRSEASRLLIDLFSKALLREQVISSISNNGSLAPDVRKLALEFAREWPDSAEALNSASWGVVSQPNQPADLYAKALLQAEAACRIEPENGYMLNTLGVAQYRCGRFSEAVNTLTRCSEVNAKKDGYPFPADVAFLALAHYELGHHEEAKKLLHMLRQMLDQVRWKGNSEAKSFLHEGESVIEREKSAG